MPESHRFVLRELPGVSKLEARLELIYAHPSPAWCKEADGLADDVDRLSRQLFGISTQDTEFPYDATTSGEGGYRRWEQHFALLGLDDEAGTLIVFDAMGWDVRPAEAEMATMYSIDFLGRQIVCAAKGLCGHLPTLGAPGGELTEDELERVESTLADEAERFRRRKR